MTLVCVLALSGGSDTSNAAGPYPKALNTNADTDAAEDEGVQIATDSNGNWVAAWQEELDPSTNIFEAHSADNDETWSSPQHLNPWSGGASHDVTPSLATDGNGTWIAVWETDYPYAPGDPGEYYHLVYARSFDNGATWTAPLVLTGLTASNRIGRIAYAGGTWLVTFQAAISGDPHIEFTRSTNSGANWSAPAPIWPAQPVDVYDGDQDSSAASDGSGNWLALWTVETGGVHTALLKMSRSTDDGVSWSVPVVVSPISGSTKDKTPSVATDGAGKWLLEFLNTTAGYTDTNAYTSLSTDFGGTWSAPHKLGAVFDYSATTSLINTGSEWQANWAGSMAASADGINWSSERVVGVADGGVVGHGQSDRTIFAYFAYDNQTDTDVLYTPCDPGDADCDTSIDGVDNCPAYNNFAQADADTDTVGDLCDRCPQWPNAAQNVPAWPIGPQFWDEDCDGFNGTATGASGLNPETFLGTDPNHQCANTPARNDEAGPDAWPADFDDNQTSNGSDIHTFAPHFGGVQAQGPRYHPRWDLSTGHGSNGPTINGSDILKMAPFFGKFCTP